MAIVMSGRCLPCKPLPKCKHLNKVCLICRFPLCWPASLCSPNCLTCPWQMKRTCWMNKCAKYIAVSSLCLFLYWTCAKAVLASQDEILEMEVGEVKVLSWPSVARVAVGDGQVLNALSTDEQEVIVFAKNEGVTSLHIWSSSGERKKYQVDVALAGSRQL